MFAAFVLTLAAFGIMQQTVSGAWRFTMQYWSVLRGGVLVFSVGLWDDYGRLSYRIKFAVQLLASSLVYANGLGVAQLAGFELFPVVGFRAHRVLVPAVHQCRQSAGRARWPLSAAAIPVVP